MACGTTLKWRWDPASSRFLLIGETYEMVDTVGQEAPTSLDINFSTLKGESTTGKKKKSCVVPAAVKGKTLADFVFDPDHFDELPKLCR